MEKDDQLSVFLNSIWGIQARFFFGRGTPYSNDWTGPKANLAAGRFLRDARFFFLLKNVL